MDLPENPTPEQLAILQKYLKQLGASSKKKTKNQKTVYLERTNIIGTKLFIYKNNQVKSNNWYMRFYTGNKKYKILSLRTVDKEEATEKALEKWRTLKNHVETGGEIFEVPVQKTIDQYIEYLEELVETGQMGKTTLNGKKTSIKKLRLIVENYDKPSDIPSNVFHDYIVWRRTKNWDRRYHKNNPNPPSDMTIDKELSDFKGYFAWCKSKRIYVQDLEFPKIKIDWSKSVEKNPAYTLDDWKSIVYYLRTWVKKTKNAKGNALKNPFYRLIFSEFLKIQANSGLRPHECLLLRWSNVQLRSKMEISSSDPGKKRERIIAHIEVPPNTKTGRRLVICPAGVYFKRLHKLYKDKLGESPKQSDFILQNVGTSHFKGDKHFGDALTDGFLRNLWYALRDEIGIDKGVFFEDHYTIYSARSFFINQRLEMGVPPAIVAELVGHSIKTMERHYKNIRLKQLEPELVNVRRQQLGELDFQTFDLE